MKHPNACCSCCYKEAPPDSLTVSLAMAMAIQTQFLKILLVDDKTAEELLAVQKPESQEIVRKLSFIIFLYFYRVENKAG